MPLRRGRKRAMRPDDLHEIAWIREAEISPDGERIAFVVQRLDRESDETLASIWVVPVRGRAAARQVTSGEAKDGAPRWSPDGRWLAFTSKRDGDEAAQVYLMPAEGGEPRRLTSLSFGAGAPSWSPDSTRLLFSAKTGTPWPKDSKRAKPYRRIETLKYRMNGEGFTHDRVRHLFVLDVTPDGTAGRPRQVTRGRADDTQPAWSPDGRRIAFVSARHADADFDTWNDIWVVEAKGGRPRRLTRTSGACGGPVWSPDGRRIAYTFAVDAPSNRTLWTVDVRTGRAEACDPAFDRQTGGDIFAGDAAAAWLPDGRLVSVAQDRGIAAPIVVRRGGRTEWLARGSRTVHALSLSADGRTAAVVASTVERPPEVFVLDVPGRRMRQRTSLNASWLARVQTQPARRFPVETAPGVEVDCWVMEPSGRRPGRRYPVLLNVHGGPFGQYGETFFDEFQVYAGAGYGVVFCNPRGSSGQSTEFARAIVGRLGETDYDDVMAAFEAALARISWADGRRLGVMGGSYGGFMTSWIVGHTDRFAAAVSERAVNDWYLMEGTSDIGSYFNERYLGEGANPWTDVLAVLRQSPATYSRAIRTPLLILHSEDDLRCPISQAEALYVALKKQRKDVEFVRFPDEHHEMSRSGRPSHRLGRFEVILDFFARKMA
jgi:dipeptidyl aminopeptidase/acylaminoacyl peptidase